MTCLFVGHLHTSLTIMLYYRLLPVPAVRYKSNLADYVEVPDDFRRFFGRSFTNLIFVAGNCAEIFDFFRCVPFSGLEGVLILGRSRLLDGEFVFCFSVLNGFSDSKSSKVADAGKGAADFSAFLAKVFAFPVFCFWRLFFICSNFAT